MRHSPAVSERATLRGDERGIALAIVLFGLVIMGAVLSGSYLAVRLDRTSSSYTTYTGEANGAAEAGLAAAYANWDPLVQNVMPIYDGTPDTEYGIGLTQVGTNPMVLFADSIRRLNQELFLVRSYGVRRDAGGNTLSRLGLAQLFRIVKPTIGVNAAVTVMDPLKLNGNSFMITGMNNIPPQWGVGECDAVDPANSDDVVGVRSATETGVTSADYDNVSGFPTRDAANDPSITSETFQDFLDYTYNTLASAPGVKVLPDNDTYNGVGPVLDLTTLPASCDKTQLLNFGEPYRNPPSVLAVIPCYPYFPVVHGTGTRTKFAAGSRGQGTLLVDGDLELSGGFEWVGLIIVRGSINVNGTGNKLTGAVLAEGVDLITSGAVSGDVEIRYSQCAIEKAVGGASLAQPLGQRSWLHLY